MTQAPLNEVGATDYEKVRRLPFLYLFSMLTGAAVLIGVGAPFVLFLTELGFESNRIGLLGGMMPFFQILGVAFLPLIMRFGSKRIAMVGYTTRYLFLLLFLLVPYFISDLNTVFWILFIALAMFSLARAFAEAAFVPWSQEIIPRSMRGSISGKLSVFYLPVGLVVSYAVKLWLDSRVGLDRFYPIFIIAIIVGILGAASLQGLEGGRRRDNGARGMAAIRSLGTPLQDRNFRIFLFSSGTQYLVFLVVNLFLILYFKEKFGVASGQLVFMASLFLIGGAGGSFAGGWLVDRHGSRGVRITMQVAQVFLLLGVTILPVSAGDSGLILGAVFVGFGFLFGGSMTAANVYLLNYVPPETKESYMALAYSVDGIIGGSATFAAGLLLYWLQNHPSQIFGITLGSYETLFVLSALVIASSSLAYGYLQEEGATGVKDFIRQFYAGNPLGLLWGIHRYGHQTSEERRLDLTYRFGGSGSILARQELFDALRDPSFDVRYEAIVSLGHFSKSDSVVKALESMLAYDGLVELQYAALTSLGRIGATESNDKIVRFLRLENPLLRARAIRTIGDIRDTSQLSFVRDVLKNDPDVDCRLAAVSALGKMKDRESLSALFEFYCSFDTLINNTQDEPRSKVILLALSKILNREGVFSQEWRREEKNPGVRMPVLMKQLASMERKFSSDHDQSNFKNISNDLAVGNTVSGFKFLQNLRPIFQSNDHQDAKLVLMILDASKNITSPHPALLILLCVVMAPILRKKSHQLQS